MASSIGFTGNVVSELGTSEKLDLLSCASALDQEGLGIVISMLPDELQLMNFNLQRLTHLITLNLGQEHLEIPPPAASQPKFPTTFMAKLLTTSISASKFF